MDNFTVFPDRLKEVRKRTKMTQKEFAQNICGCTPATLSSYENGANNPSLEVVRTIAKKCKVSLDWLCGLADKEALDEKITTYSNLFEILLKLKKSFPHLMGIDDLRGFEPEVTVGIAAPFVLFNDIVIYEIFKEWKKMSDLLESNIIDDEIFDLWVEKTLLKYNKSIDEKNQLPF